MLPVGEFKDDTIKKHEGSFRSISVNPSDYSRGVFIPSEGYGMNIGGSGYAIYPYICSMTIGTGTTTHGKQKGVKYIIKVL